MGTLQTTIKLNDQFTNQLNKINKSIQNTANAMNRLNSSNASSVKSVNSTLSQQISQNNTIMKQLGSWATKLRNIATIYFGIRGAVEGINRAVSLSDRMTMTDAKFNLVAGGNKKLAGDLKEKTFAAAQRSTTDYLEFGKAVGKLGILAGDKFKNQDSIVRFVELMNKSFQISGADTSERNAAMLQITQAIASNRLQGDEFRSILENAPMVMDALTKSLGVGHDALKKMAKEGQITADVLIKAMFDAGTKIEEMYKQLPMTWERHWAKIKNVGVLAFEPIHRQLEKLFNSEKFQAFVNGLCTAMIVLGNLGGKALELLAIGVNKVIDGFKGLKEASGFLGFLIDVVTGLTAAWVINSLWTGIVTAAQWLHAWATVAVTTAMNWYKKATQGATVWQSILNLLTGNWAILIVAALAIAIAWLIRTSDSWIDGISRIVGGLYWLWEVILNVLKGVVNVVWIVLQAIGNALKWVWDFIQVVAHNIGVAFVNGWNAALNGFWNFVKSCLDGIKVLAPAINKIAELFGKKGFDINAFVDGKINSTNITSNPYKSLPKFGKINTELLGYNSLQSAYDKGYGKSEKYLTKVEDKFGKLGSNIGDKLDNLTKVDLNGQKLTSDALNGMNDKLGDVGTNTGNTANNTGDIAANTSNTEDYSYLRNWAYNKGMGNSIGYNIKIEQNNKNNIGSNMDLNRVVDAVRDAIIEGIMTQAEGVR